MTRGGKEVVGRRVVVTSEFEANRENIWCKIQDIDTLREICKPKASFISYDNTSPTWKEGKSFCFKMFHMEKNRTKRKQAKIESTVINT